MKKISAWMLVLLLVPGVILLTGCKKEETVEETPATTDTAAPMETTTEPMSTDMGTTDMGTDMSAPSTDTTPPPAQ